MCFWNHAHIAACFDAPAYGHITLGLYPAGGFLEVCLKFTQLCLKQSNCPIVAAHTILKEATLAFFLLRPICRL